MTAHQQSAYEHSGVSIEAGSTAVSLMAAAVRSTYNERVIAGIGSFGGVFDAAGLGSLTAPALVASTDGVGTKTMIAAAMGHYESLGVDIVNHCINDILVQGAEPLFFLDYIAAPKLDPQVVASIVTGIAAACRAAGCVLLGGETAEMPGVYQQGQLDVAGTIVGVVERAQMLPLPTVVAGDAVLGLPSSGPHTNGYSLIRSVFADTPLHASFDGIGVLGEALLAPHRSYLDAIRRLRRRVQVKALAHLTGGGFVENIPRVLPAGTAVRLAPRAWPIPPLFDMIQQKGRISRPEMYRVFNMGIGMVAIVGADDVPAAAGNDDQMWHIGDVVDGDRMVLM